MNRLKAFAMLATMSVLLTGCGNKKNDSSEYLENPEVEICDFNDFQYLMFTENDQSVIRDADGNEYLIQTDGYYYDVYGRKITTYGVGDLATAKLGASTGAIGKSGIKDLDKSNNSSGKPNSGATNSDGSPEEGVVGNEQSAEDYDDSVIADWDSAKMELMEAEGKLPTTEPPWHGQSNDLDSFQAGSGDNALSSHQSYNTNINLGTSMPCTLTIDSVNSSNNCSITGKLTLDSNSYNEYMKGLYGDTQFDDAGNEVQANYTAYLKEQYCTFAIVATDGISSVSSDVQSLYFNDNYTVEFSLSLKVPEGYTPYLTIQDIPYNL